MRRAVIALVLAGCPSKQPVDPTHTPAGPKSCERMADHLLGLMQPRDASGKPIAKEPETADAITRTLIQRCTDDKWTMDAQQCFLGLAKLDDAGTCASLLTVDQRNAMDAAMDQALGPRATPAESPPPPPPPPGKGAGEEDPCQGGQ